MYSWEIRNLLQAKKNLLTIQEMINLTDTEINPQIRGLDYNKEEDKYYSWDNEGNVFEFRLIKKRGEKNEKQNL